MGAPRKVVASHGPGRVERSVQNRRQGKAFLEENRKKEGVVTLPSGLQYRVIKEGKGPAPDPTDWVTVNYRGTLLDGTEFDSSFSRGEPETLRVNGVIQGWREALLLMNEGARWELFIPSEQAYGAQGVGTVIGPNSTLLFEVELVSISKEQGAS